MTRLLFILLLLPLAACTASGPGGTSGGSGTTSAGTSSGGSTGGHGGVLCSGDLECASGQCLGGRCCASHCLVPDGSCGATACLADGGCDYPGTTVGCGGGTCDVSNHFTPPKSCDGAGTCHDPGSQDCGEFTCLGNVGCPDHCIDDTVCFPGTHCFPKQGLCCPPVAPGSTVYVDCLAGSDTGCCGTGPGAAACLTLTAAMDAIDRSHATGATVSASVGGGSGDWSAPETWPVTLHRGVTLSAPGVFFFVLDSSHFVLDLFEAIPADANDTLPVTLQGDPANYLHAGFDQDALETINTYDALVVRGLTARLKYTWLGGTANGAQVEDAATLEIDGPARFGAYESPGHVGLAPSARGIVCSGLSAAVPATVIDPGASDGDLVIQGQSTAGIYVLSACNITLEHAATFGFPPVDGGCPNPKPDNIGLLADGDTMQVTLSGPVFQCLQVDGVQLIRGDPLVTLNHAHITHCGCMGLRSFAGRLYSNGSVIANNYTGVAQVGGTVVLSGGGTGGMSGGNTIGCNQGTEPGACLGEGVPGVDVLNESAGLLDADNCLFDHAPPSELSCTDPTFASCTCVSLPSTACPTLDGTDLATTSTGALSSAGGGTNALICN